MRYLSTFLFSGRLFLPKERVSPLIVLCLLAVLFFGCAPKVTTKMLVPAKCPDAAMLKRIAVLNFEGRAGEAVRADVESLLLSIKVNNEQFFTVIDRTAVDRILSEQMLQQTGVTNSQTAIKVGNLLGADGIMMGVITDYNVRDKYYQEERKKCLDYKNGKCKNRVNFMVNCVERNAYFSFTPKLIKVSTGEIVLSEPLSGQYQDRVCRDEEGGLADDRVLLGQAKDYAIEKLRELLAPYSVSVELNLITKDDSEMSDTVKNMIESGMKWAKEGRLDRACEFWDSAYRLHNQGYALPYLLGVCSEVSGNPEKALIYYQQADRSTGSPVDEITEALGRVRERIEQERALKEQFNK